MKKIRLLLKRTENILSVAMSLFEYRILWRAVFAFYKLTVKSDRKTVLFADPYSTDLTDNMKPIYAALEKRGGFNLITCFSYPPSDSPQVTSAKSSKLRQRFNRSLTYLRFLKLYASCGALILTESYLPAYAVKKKSGVEVLQLWHGSGAFKKWGYSTLDTTFGADRKSVERFPMHNCYTLVPVSSDTVIPAYADAFRCDSDVIKPLGVPRTDIYFDKDFVSTARARLYDSHPDLHRFGIDDFLKKTVVLYAPTFRGENITEARSGVELDFERLRRFYENDFIFLIKLHPFIKNSFKVPLGCEDFVFDVSDMPTDTVLCSADALVSDYSSIIFEYSLLGRPIIFYDYDLTSFVTERDFYYPYKEFIPGREAATQDELESCLSRLSDDLTAQVSRLSHFSKEYMSACDGKAAERIADEIVKRLS